MDKEVETTKKYFVLLPTKQAHENFHPTLGVAGFAQRVHPKIIERINELVGGGITDVQEVKRALRHYIIHALFPDPSYCPYETNRAYLVYPTCNDIKNHVYSAKRAQELSKLDQDNLKLKIEQWKKESPTTMFHYRPYKEIQQESTKTTFKETADSVTFSQTLLYVHQEKWQQHLLGRYGNTIVLMDATYKTTKYELPMFFITVKTNVQYTAVADFVVQSETSEQIIEAIKVIASWNPEWNPPYFMTDCSDAEITAIESVFSQCKAYLRDFHHEQCWERWIKERAHGLSPVDGEILLGKLRKCAWAAPGTGSLAEDHYYQQEVDNLKQTDVWKRNKQVRDWLNAKWLPFPKVCIICELD